MNRREKGLVVSNVRHARWPRLLLVLFVVHLAACGPSYRGAPPGVADLPPESSRILLVEQLQDLREGDAVFVELRDGAVVRGDYRAHDERTLTVVPIDDVDDAPLVLALADVLYVEEVEIGFGRRATHVLVLGGLIAAGIVASIMASFDLD